MTRPDPRDDEAQPVLHLEPLGTLTRCCARSATEIPSDDRFTREPSAVTCADQHTERAASSPTSDDAALLAPGRTWWTERDGPDPRPRTALLLDPSASSSGYVHVSVYVDTDGPTVLLTPATARAVGLALIERAALLDAHAGVQTRPSTSPTAPAAGRPHPEESTP